MLWAVTCYFNPCGFKSKLRNYQTFLRNLEKQGVPLRTIEVSSGDFEIDADIQIHSDQILWHKECLLNIAARSLPDDCEKVAWLDCDVLFLDDDWHSKADKMLDDKDFIQLYEEAVFLSDTGVDFTSKSMLYQFFNESAFSDGHPHQGWPGLAFAGRRDIELYESCILGMGDVVLSSAVTQDFWVIDQWAFSWKEEIKEWCRNKSWNGGWLPGTIIHLYHGSLQNRRYPERSRVLEKHGYHPSQLSKDENGCLVLNNPDLQKAIKLHLESQKEDEKFVPRKMLL